MWYSCISINRSQLAKCYKEPGLNKDEPVKYMQTSFRVTAVARIAGSKLSAPSLLVSCLELDF